VFVSLEAIVVAFGQTAGSVDGQKYPKCMLFGETFTELSFLCLAIHSPAVQWVELLGFGFVKPSACTREHNEHEQSGRTSTLQSVARIETHRLRHTIIVIHVQSYSLVPPGFPKSTAQQPRQTQQKGAYQ